MVVKVKAFKLQTWSATAAPKEIEISGECRLMRVGTDGQVYLKQGENLFWVKTKQLIAPPDVEAAVWVIQQWDGRDIYHPNLQAVWVPESGGNPYRLAGEILAAYVQGLRMKSDQQPELIETRKRGT